MDTFAENNSVAIQSDQHTAAAEGTTGGEEIRDNRGAGIMVDGGLAGTTERSQHELATAPVKLESLPLPPQTEGI